MADPHSHAATGHKVTGKDTEDKADKEDRDKTAKAVKGNTTETTTDRHVSRA